MRSSTLAPKKKAGLLLFLLLAPLSTLFFIGGPQHSHPLSVHYAWNLGHFLFFFIVTLAFHFTIGFKSLRQALAYLFFVFIVSVAIETVQAQLGRFFSVTDIARNLLGACFVLSMAFKTLKYRWLTLLLALLVLADFSRLGFLFWLEHKLAQRLPIIENFEQPRLTSYWRNNIIITQDNSYSGHYTGKVQLQPGTYASVFFSPLPRNWLGYRQLELAVFWPEAEPRTVNVRLHDIAHENKPDKPSNDRFNQSFVLTSGWNRLQIDLQQVELAPASRRLDLTQMHSLGIFFTQQQQPGWILIDDVLLKP